MYKNYPDYLYSLLNSPLKRVKKSKNTFFIFFKIMAELFDDCVDDILKLREELSLITCSDSMLDVFGQDYDLPKLNGENTENYRKRLIWKKKTAQLGGTKKGVQEVLSSLGYGQSELSLVKEFDPSKWAEFYVILRKDKELGINDLRLLDAEIRKIKQASSLPRYMSNSGSSVVIHSSNYHLKPKFPLCGLFVCGTYPKKGVS